VETVAWVTELKNLQSTLFYLLALLAWLKFVEKPVAPKWSLYCVALACHALALFSKTTACTLPAALLLVIWWRGEAIGRRRVLQVLPFVLMSLAMGLVSMWWEKHLRTYVHEPGIHLSFMERVLVASRAVWFYAGKLLWPANLAFSYPRWDLNPHAPWQYLGLAGCLGLALLWWWRRHTIPRGLTAAVIFFVAALSPLLGFITLYTFRFSFVADHYQYLACVGLILPFAALVSTRWASTRFGPAPALYVPAALLLVLGLLSWNRTLVYEDPQTLWRDTLAKNPACWMAHNNLGVLLRQQGQIDAAMDEYEQALRFNPDYPEAHNNLGITLATKGQTDEAIHEFRESLRLKPDYAEAHANLGHALALKGQIDEVISQYQEAIRLKPELAGIRNSLGIMLEKKGKFDEAIRQFQEAVHLQPDYPQAQNNLGNALRYQGRYPEAIPCFQRCIRLQPRYAGAYFGLADAFRGIGRIDDAVRAYEAGLQLKPDEPEARDELGKALLQQGHIPEAIAQFQEALRLKPNFADARKNLTAALAGAPRASQPRSTPSNP
jgi:tetratricopeptide (TPR) repeat protein